MFEHSGIYHELLEYVQGENRGERYDCDSTIGHGYDMDTTWIRHGYDMDD